MGRCAVARTMFQCWMGLSLTCWGGLALGQDATKEKAEEADKKSEATETKSQSSPVIEEKTIPIEGKPGAAIGGKPEKKLDEKSNPTTEPRLRFYSSAPGGETGLINVMEAGSGPTLSMRISLFGGFFSSGDFLNPNNATQNYTESQVVGKLGLSFTPFPFLEVFANLRNSSNKNSASRPSLLQTQGDLELGAKGCYAVLPYLSLGLNLGVGFYNGIGEVTPQFDGTSVRTSFLASFDLRPLAPKIPLRAHLNAGMIFENTGNLEGNRKLSYVEQYALRVDKYHRVALGFGLDAPLAYLDPVAIVPFIEYTVQIPVGISDSEMAAGSLGESTSLIHILPMRLTPGVRVTYLRDITLDVAVDIGIGGEKTDRGFEKAYLSGVPSTPPYMVWIGLAYAWEPFKRLEKQIVEMPIEKVVEKIVVPPVTTGRVAGRVISNVDQTAVAGAILSFEGGGITPVATDELEGRYSTYDLTVGTIKLTAQKSGYKTLTQEIEVKAGEMSLIDFALEPDVKKGTINGSVHNEKDLPVVATIDLLGPSEAHVNSVAETGMFSAEVPPGSYDIKVSAEGYLAKGRSLELKENQLVSLEFKLTPAPQQRVVVIEKNKIVVQKKIHFETGKAVLTADSYPILDSVIDILVNHPEIKKLRVEGHTDSQGARAMNLKLSQQRADAVKDYLVQQGFPATKLESQGFGPDKPIAPNTTLRGKEQNRRVEFVILDQ